MLSFSFRFFKTLLPKNSVLFDWFDWFDWIGNHLSKHNLCRTFTYNADMMLCVFFLYHRKTLCPLMYLSASNCTIQEAVFRKMSRRQQRAVVVLLRNSVKYILNVLFTIPLPFEVPVTVINHCLRANQSSQQVGIIHKYANRYIICK